MSYLWITLNTAVTALRRNIMRSTLTILGVVIGVAAVIAMVEIGKGASKKVQSTIENMGAGVLQVYPRTSSSRGVSMGTGTGINLTPQDVEALRDSERCPAIRSVAPLVRARTQVVYKNKNCAPHYVLGTSPEYLDVRNWGYLEEGVCFTERDNRTMRSVCVLGQTVVKELFGKTESPIGRQVRINNKPFTVIGVLARKGASMMGFDQDDVVLAPWRTIKFKVVGESTEMVNQSAVVAADPLNQVNTLNNLYPSEAPQLYPLLTASQAANSTVPVRFMNIDRIMLRAHSVEDIPAAIEQATIVLRERHRLEADEPNDFHIRDMTSISRALGTTSNLMSVLLIVVAIISLVVGGVGIMNIMLVSVTERTREIGLRMAVGAKRRDILIQFLVESAMLCMLGGIIGIALGRGGSLLVRLTLNWATEVSFPAIFTAVGVSLAVGVVFGYYPAWKASRLDPIEALRYE